MADIIKGYKVSYAAYSATKPTSDWIELANCIRSLPNFFTDPEAVDTTCIDNTVKTSVPGLSGGAAYAFKVAVNKEFLTAHAAMVADQTADAKGSFWIQVELTNRGKKLTFPATTVLQLPTPEGAAGALDEITWNVYMNGNPEIEDITAPQA